MKKWQILILIIMLPNFVRAEANGGYAGAFLRMGLGARALSMGNAFVAVANDGYASYYNPAGLPGLTHRHVTLSFSFLPLDRKMNYIGYAQNIRPKIEEGERVKVMNAGFSLGWINSGVDNIDGRDLNGKPIGTFSNSENAFYFSFAMSPHRIISIGFSAKVLYNRFPKMTDEEKAVTATGLGLDFGILLSPIRGLSTGLCIRDLNSKYTWNTQDLWSKGSTTIDRFLTVVRWGIAYQVPGEWLLVTLDLEDNNKQNGRYYFGMELRSPAGVAVRSGLNNGDLSFGLGFEAKLLGRATSLDYAYVSDPYAPRGDHIFSWVFKL